MYFLTKLKRAGEEPSLEVTPRRITEAVPARIIYPQSVLGFSYFRCKILQILSTSFISSSEYNGKQITLSATSVARGRLVVDEDGRSM